MRRLLIHLNLWAPLISLSLLASGNWCPAILLLLPGHMLVLWGTLSPSCTWFGNVITQIPGNDVVLTFDDGPHELDTPYILSELRRHNARAIFFLIGNRAAQHPDLVRQILADGHFIGNHTQTHPHPRFWMLLPSQFDREIRDCQDTLTEITRHSPTLFRPPVGHHNPFLHPVLGKYQLPLIGWSARGFDGVSSAPEAVLSRMLPQIHPGGILLLHEGPRMADGSQLITKTLPAVLAHLQERGLATTLPHFPPP